MPPEKRTAVKKTSIPPARARAPISVQDSNPAAWNSLAYDEPRPSKYLKSEQRETSERLRAESSEEPESPSSQGAEVNQLVALFQSKWRKKSLARAKKVEVRCEQRLEEAVDASRSELEEHDGAIDRAIHDLKRRFVKATDEQTDVVKRLRLGLDTIAENDGVLADRVVTNITNMHRARREGHKTLQHLLKDRRTQAATLYANIRHTTQAIIQHSVEVEKKNMDFGRLQAALLEMLEM